MPISPSELVKGKRYSITVGDTGPTSSVHRILYNVIYRGVWHSNTRGDRMCFESDYMWHLVERAYLREIEPWRIQL